MNFEMLQKEKLIAMKERNEVRKNAITNMIDAIQKASITPKGRVEITDALVDEVLIKYQKSVQEQIDTCPAARIDLAAAYNAEMSVVKEFAPQLMTDRGEIEKSINNILNGEVPLTKANRGNIMKLITPHFKGKADMKIVSEVIGKMLV